MLRMLIFACACGLLVGCGDGGGGDDDDDDMDAGGDTNTGFVTPTATTEAWLEVDGVWESQGPADWSCLGTPSTDMPTVGDIALTGVVEDFQNGTPVAMADIEMFPGVDFDNVLDSTTADMDANYSLTVPMDQERLGFKVTADGTLDTFLLNQYFTPDDPDQSLTLNSVSELTANALPAFIGVTRTPGLGVLAGALRDCQEREVSNAIATVSSVSGSIEHLDGAQSYYFSAGSTSLPVRHSLAAATNKDGLFIVIELPVATEAYMQVWGFTPDQDPAVDEMTLLAELPSPVRADSIITASIEPLRSSN